jgi:hypothetical protein
LFAFLNIILGMPTRQRLSVARIVSLLDCGHWIAFPLMQDATDEWLDSLPLFAAPDRSSNAIAIILESAYNYSGSIQDVLQSAEIEDMLSGIVLSWTLTWFTNSSVRLIPQKADNKIWS